MKIYLAASYTRKEAIKAIACELEKCGHAVTSTWIKERFKPTVEMADVRVRRLRELAERDVDEIDAADALVFLAEDQDNQPPRGGRHVEFGYALAKGKQVLVVGEQENIFHHLPLVQVFPDWKEAMAYLKERR